MEERIVARRKGRRGADQVVLAMLHYAQAYTVAVALDLGLSFVDVVFLLAISGVLGAVPIAIGGLGVRELFFALAVPVAR